jgi:hypothetical protein
MRTLAIIALAVFIAAPAVFADHPARKVPNGQAGNSNTAHLYLYEKDPTTWEIVDKGAWGKMRYRLAGEMFDFVFNGHKLEAGMMYSLIYYPDPWPGNGLICIGSAMADDEGNVHLEGLADTGDLPADYDDNYMVGAKIWLVLSADVDCDMQYMIGWNPAEYLFEYDLITFDADDAPAMFLSPPSPDGGASWSEIKVMYR